MGEKEVFAHAEGFVVGWNKCRHLICERYNLNKDEVIAWENSDDVVKQKEEKK